MARARIIKPGFFKNDILSECSMAARVLFAGLWTLADRMGRLEDRPKQIKGEIFPHDAVNVDDLLNELVKHNFIIRYEARNNKYIQVLTFEKHQKPHTKEIASTIPSYEEAQPKPGKDEPKSDQSFLNLNPLTLNLNPEAGAVDAPDASEHVLLGEQISKITGWDKDPNWGGDYGRIEQWLANGWDAGKDIIPTVKRLMGKRKEPPGNLKYFERAIADAYATRTAPLPEGKVHEITGRNPTKTDRKEAATKRALQRLGIEETDQPDGEPMLRQLEHLREGAGTA